MNKTLLLLPIVCTSLACGQGIPAPDPGEIPGNLPLPTFEFVASLSGTNEVPPNNSIATGTGVFTLEGNSFRYQVSMPLPFAPTGASIHGPAKLGQTAPPLFTLDGPRFVSPYPPAAEGGFAFTGSRALSSEEIGQLLAGLWYVNVHSVDFPDGELRGQILPVPTLEFVASLSGTNEVPPNNSTATGTGVFTLEGNSFRYQVSMPLPFAPTGASIYGPAKLGQTAPPLFTLDGPRFVSPYPPAAEGGFAFTGSRALSSEEISQLLAGLWYVNVRSVDFPEGELRGQILPTDSDGDGIPDDEDQCPNTPRGAVVDANGCSIDQLCACHGNWRSHAEYVRCVIRVTAQFQRARLITSSERRVIVSEAVRSDCGKRLAAP